MDSPSQEKIFGNELSRRLVESPFFDPTGSVVLALDCRHIEAVRRIAAQSFPAVWAEKEFAYFLAHENRVCMGTFTQAPEGPRLRAYFLGLLIQGDLDIISIATVPEDRRLGLGEALVRRVISLPVVRRAFLEVEVDNEPAIRLYEKLGFQTLGRRRAYYGPDRDALLMRWEKTSESRI